MCTSDLRGSDRLSPALCNIVPPLPALIARLPSVSEVLLLEERPPGEGIAGSVMTSTDVHFPIVGDRCWEHQTSTRYCVTANDGADTSAVESAGMGWFPLETTACLWCPELSNGDLVTGHEGRKYQFR